MDTITHGRSAYVNRKCRCDVCVEANRQHVKQFYQSAKNKAKKAAAARTRNQRPEVRARNLEVSRRWRAANPERYAENKRAWIEKNREIAKATRDRWRLKNQFGITIADRQNIEDMQGGVCAICWQPPAEGHVLVIDHCHLSGKVRGLLCNWCNVALGSLQDNPTLARRAAEYLEKAKE